MSRKHGDWRREIDEQIRQGNQFFFETFKHFTTLDTAAALIVIGLYRYLGVEAAAVLGPLIAFGFSLALCAFGMLSVALGGLNEIKLLSRATVLLITGVIAFFVGLYWSVYYIFFP